MRVGRFAALAVAFGAACTSGKDRPSSGPVASVVRSSLSLSAGSVPADGVTPARISVTVRDEAGNPIAGATVSLAYTGSARLPGSAATDASGLAVLQLTASEPTAGTVTATISTSASVAVGGAPQLAFHGCPAGTTFVDGACVPPPFVRFPPAQPTWAGIYPRNFAVGDLDGNGLADVVVPGASGSSAVDVLLASDGKLVHTGRYDAGTWVNDAVVADVTGDAIADVLTSGQGGLLVFPGRGDGTLGDASAYATHSTAFIQAAADLDGDGDVDVVLSVPDGIGVMLNLGAAGFAPLTQFTGTGLYPEGGAYAPDSVALGDMNGDGVTDAASSYGNANAVVIQLGNGDGTFAAPAPSATGVRPSSLALADIDGNGRLDVVTANYGTTASVDPQTVSVLLGNGDGTLASHAEFATGANPVSVAAGDLDGDGHADVVTADSNGHSVTVLFGTPSGALESPIAYAVRGASRVAIARLEATATPGIVVLDWAAGTVSTLLGSGGRRFSGTSVPQPLAPMMGDIASGDVDGDGHTDVVAVGYALEAILVRGRGDGTFFAPVRVPIPGNIGYARYVSVRDLDGDGRDDVVVLEASMGQAFVLLADASGELGALTAYPVGSYPRAAAFGDLNGDGYTDMVVANGSGATVSVLLGQAGATFGPAVQYPAGSVAAIALGDLDGDGHLDAVVGGWWPWALRVLRGDGAGGFAAPEAYPAGSSTSALEMGVIVEDLDGDGDLDAALTDAGGNAVGIFLGTGDGTFAPRTTYAVAPRPSSVSSGDVDGDGHRDLVTSDTNGTLTLLRGNGDGTCAAGISTYVPWSPPGRALVVDLDGDAYRDVVVSVSDRFHAYRGSATGLEGWRPVGMGTRPSMIQVADLDGDGHLDLVTASEEAYNVTVARGNGDGTFAPSRSQAVGGYPKRLAIADVNGDQKLDVVLTHTSLDELTGTIGVLLGNGDGTFGAEITTAAGVAARAVAVGDVTGDGKPDAVIGGNGAARLLVGLGTGSFAPPVTIAGSPSTSSYAALADLEGDGKLDLVVASWAATPGEGRVAILLGNGDGTFRSSLFSVADPLHVVVGDFDSDGDLDVAVASNSPPLTLLRGDGSGAFASEEHLLPSVGLALAAADLDLDGDLDLVTGGVGTFGAHRNDGGTGFTSTSFLLPFEVQGLAVADLDGDGRPDVVLLNGAGAFPLLNRVP